MKKCEKVFYGCAILVAVLGYIASFVIAGIVDSSVNQFERGVYEEETRYMTTQLFEGIQLVSNRPTIVDVASIYDINDPNDFNIVSSSLFYIPGVDRVSMVDIVRQEDLDEEEVYLSELYNQTINTFVISNHTVVGEYAIVQFTSPDFIGLIGLIVNSDEERDYTIREVIETKKSVIVDNIVLQDDSGLGRLIFHPILIDGEVLRLLVMVVTYNEFFDTYTSQFTGLFPESSLGVVINEQYVYIAGNPDNLTGVCSSSGPISICVSEWPSPNKKLTVLTEL